MPPPPNQPKRRRLLSLPAVCPCESIAPAPLLASLLSLAADLASRGAASDAFPVLHRGVRHAVRVAGLLLAFLEEVQDASVSEGASLPASAVLGLTEMHVAMQKLRFLLIDCVRRGARLWVLVNAGLAASELRAALGSIAAAMDVLPRSVADASAEAGELARLASDQAWRVLVWPDAADERAARSVRSILEQFNSGASPDVEDVRRVLDRIGVRTWADCSEEIAFLEDELRALPDGEGNGSSTSSSDVVRINSLIALLVYCRVVLFDHIGNGNTADHAPRPAARCPPADWIRPDALQCPITLDLMTDPVTVCTGQTYDRAAITRWVEAGCRTCPVTGERLRTAGVVPNAAIRGIIERVLRSNGVSLPDAASSSGPRHGTLGNTAVPFGRAAAGAARLAVAYIIAQLRTGSTAERRKATSEARKLSKHNAFYRACLVEANAVPWLLCLLSSTDVSVQDSSVASLLNLSKHPRGRTALFEAGGVGLVVDVVNVGARAEARQNAAAVLFYLASGPEQAEEIGRVPEAVPTLVQLVRDGAHRGRKNAMVSLYGLLQCPANHGKAVATGAVPALAAMLSADQLDDDLARDAVTLLARLAEQPVGALALLACSGLVARVAEALSASAFRSGKDHCVALLVSLCRHGGDKVVALLGRMPGLMASLYSLIADGSPQTCKRARALVNLIHRHYEVTHPSAQAASEEAGERVVRVL
jgi:hypothetical protein